MTTGNGQTQTGELKRIERILRERARALAQTDDEAAEEDTLHLLVFTLGQERYGIDIELVREVRPLDSQTWSRVPCTPDFIVGAVNIRGHIHSVTNIANFLGLSPRPLADTAHVLLVKGGDAGGEGAMELCIVADDIPAVADVPRTDLKAAGGTISDRVLPFVRGVTPDMLLVLDLERLLSDPAIVIHDEQ